MAGKSSSWDEDITASIADYNEWYLRFTEEAYREAKAEATEIVAKTLSVTDNLRRLTFQRLWKNPEIIRGLRMTSSPPWAVDRLIGISQTSPSLVKAMEDNNTGRRKAKVAKPQLQKVIDTVRARYDLDLLPWIPCERTPTKSEIALATQTLTDRLALSIANPALRNAQEERQLDRLKIWLKGRGYQEDDDRETSYDKMAVGKYRTHVHAEGIQEDGATVTVEVDIVIKPKASDTEALPMLMECKSAGDFANVNKRRKEESDKHSNLVRKHGPEVQYVLYLSGYFGKPYLTYERAAGIQWIWHHRVDDLEKLGL